MQILLNFLVLESQNTKTARGQMRFPLGIIFLLCLVNAPVQFNNQRKSMTVKINNETINDLLTSKMITLFVRPQSVPKNLLRRRHLTPQLLGKFQLLF